MDFCFVFYCLYASRAIWKSFYRRLRFLVVLTVRKILDTAESFNSLVFIGKVDTVIFIEEG